MELKTDATGEAIVPVLACVLNQLCVRNNSLAAPDANKTVSKFHALRPPAITIKDYLIRIAKYAACSGECFVLALVYIDRIIQSNPSFVVNSLNIHRLLITSVMLAAKFFDDQYYNNAYYAKVGGVPCTEMNSLEVEFLFMTNFTLFVTTDTYRQYYTELCNHASNSNCNCSVTPVPQLVIKNIDYHPERRLGASVYDKESTDGGIAGDLDSVGNLVNIDGSSNVRAGRMSISSDVAGVGKHDEKGNRDMVNNNDSSNSKDSSNNSKGLVYKDNGNRNNNEVGKRRRSEQDKMITDGEGYYQQHHQHHQHPHQHHQHQHQHHTQTHNNNPYQQHTNKPQPQSNLTHQIHRIQGHKDNPINSNARSSTQSGSVNDTSSSAASSSSQSSSMYNHNNNNNNNVSGNSQSSSASAMVTASPHVGVM